METPRSADAAGSGRDALGEDGLLMHTDFKSSKLFQKMLQEAPHWEHTFHAFKEEYAALRDRDDQYVGRFLTCHLLIEHYLDEFLEKAHPAIPCFAESRLTFAQKISLATHPGTNVHMFLPAVRCLNSVRNKLAHDIAFQPAESDLSAVSKIMDIWNAAWGYPKTRGIAMVEQLTEFVCGMLSGMTRDIKRRHAEDGLVGLLKWWRQQ